MPLMPPNPAPRINVLMYHQVGKFAEPAAHRASYCDTDRFRAQMAYLKYGGYRVISLKQAYEALFGGGVLEKRSVVLTFDDGYQNFIDTAHPILQEYGYPSVLFAVSGLLGQPARWLEGGSAEVPLMPASALRALHGGNVEIGAHSINHVRLSRVSAEQGWDEIAGSKAALEDLLGAAVDWFCYPYGDYNREVRDAVIRAGFKAALTCSRGPANTAPNAFEIPRMGISWGDSLLGYFWKLQMKNKRKDRYA